MKYTDYFNNPLFSDVKLILKTFDSNELNYPNNPNNFTVKDTKILYAHKVILSQNEYFYKRLTFGNYKYDNKDDKDDKSDKDDNKGDKDDNKNDKDDKDDNKLVLCGYSHIGCLIMIVHIIYGTKLTSELFNKHEIDEYNVYELLQLIDQYMIEYDIKSFFNSIKFTDHDNWLLLVDQPYFKKNKYSESIEISNKWSFSKYIIIYQEKSNTKLLLDIKLNKTKKIDLDNFYDWVIAKEELLYYYQSTDSFEYSNYRKYDLVTGNTTNIFDVVTDDCSINYCDEYIFKSIYNVDENENKKEKIDVYNNFIISENTFVKELKFARNIQEMIKIDFDESTNVKYIIMRLIKKYVCYSLLPNGPSEPLWVMKYGKYNVNEVFTDGVITYPPLNSKDPLKIELFCASGLKLLGYFYIENLVHEYLTIHQKSNNLFKKSNECLNHLEFILIKNKSKLLIYYNYISYKKNYYFVNDYTIKNNISEKIILDGTILSIRLSNNKNVLIIFTKNKDEKYVSLYNIDNLKKPYYRYKFTFSDTSEKLGFTEFVTNF